MFNENSSYPLAAQHWEVGTQQPVITEHINDRTITGNRDADLFEWDAHSMRPDWLAPCLLPMLCTFAT